MKQKLNSATSSSISLSRAETYFKGHENAKLFLQTWQHPQAKGSILITHGQAEHSECYLRLVEGLSKHLPLNFIAWDLRGHGKSEGRRGYAADFDHYVLDYNIFVEECLKFDFVKNKPLLTLGHSMGGLIQSCALAHKNESVFTAQILSSPLFGLSIPVPSWKETAATVLHQLLPQVTIGNEIKFDTLTRDLDVIREYEKDVYRHNKISSGVFFGIKREVEKIKTLTDDLTLPVYMSISDDDPIISTKDALNFFNQLKSEIKVLKVVNEGKHELYNDICREEVFQSLADFCKQFLK